MVGRQSSFLVTKRSLRNSDSSSGKRPRRVVQVKNLDDTVGLSRREEQELNKALYASLQENRRTKAMPGFVSQTIGFSRNSDHSSSTSSSTITRASKSTSDGSSTTTMTGNSSSSSSSLRTAVMNKAQKVVNQRKDSLLGARIHPKRLLRHSELSTNLSIDESSQDSVRSSTSSHNGSKRKIHAQRKFAQGCSLPGMANCTPVKFTTPSVKMLSSKVPKTEDFLTFLCLRGSSILPPHLDFFNFSREELPSCDESSYEHQRESTPDSTSTSSGANDEVAEAANVSTPTMVGRNSGGLLAKRSAARASAGTPETARGIVSLRQGLQRKVSTSSTSSSLARSPASSSCLLPVSELTNTPPSRYRTKFYFIPEKSPSPSKASGIRPGEFTPPSLFSSVSHMSSTCKFSPLVCSPSKFASAKLSLGSPASQNSSPSSSSTSLSSTSVGGASKRKRRLTISSCATSKKSPLGAFTPVGASSQAGKSPGTGSAAKLRRSKDHDDQLNTVKSARKSLFGGKPQSIAQEQAKRIMGRSTGRSISNWKKHVKTKITRSGSAGRKEVFELGGRKRKKEEEKRGAQKRAKLEPSMNRRASSRLRKLTHHARESSMWQGSASGDDADSGRGAEKDHAEPSDQAHSEKTGPAVAAKPRKPYKIRPLERVRTRAYSLLLASKLALKKARRENASVKNKTSTEHRFSNESQKKKPSNIRKNPVRARPVGRHLMAPTRTSSDTYLGDQVKPRTSVASRTEQFAVSSSTSTLMPGKARSSKDTKDRIRFSAKGTFSKKAKTHSHSPTQSFVTHVSREENSVPTFRPTEAEFSDPLTYISKIQPQTEPYGMCRIVPPPSWKLDSNKISDDIRFTSQIQHIHRLYKRWGPNVQHTAAINHHLLSEMSGVSTSPQIGGIEIDLPQLYHLVEETGGPKTMNDKKHWARIADVMNIPKQAMDRSMRIYDIYCRHVFPYATLSEEEKKQLEDEVKAIHDLQTMEDDAVVRGKSMPVSWFNRIARNVQSMWFKEDATPSQIECQYWHIVEERSKHVAVHCGHINTRTQASAFPTRRDSVYSRHPWNLNNLLENRQCVLKYLGPVPGVTVPTLHMDMLFSTSCWSTNPHNLPFIQYLHTGADVIWYCIPKSQQSRFRSVMAELTPSLITDKPRWLKQDFVMINPHLLRAKGVRVGRCIHSPRQFVVVFPGACTSTISCGYSVSESVHYATFKWLPMGMEAASILSKSGEKERLSMSSLLCGLVQDENIDVATLTEALPLFSSIVTKELELRTQLQNFGLRGEKRAVFTDSPFVGLMGLKKRARVSDDEKVCDVCDKICHLSMVLNEQDEQVLCLEHGIKHGQKKKNLKSTRLFLRYNQAELETMLKDARERLATLSAKADVISTQGNKTRPALK